MYQIELKRVYAPIEESDGARVLVDRLWPRGKPRSALELIEWYRDASPSTELRRRYHQQTISLADFIEQYRMELAEHPDALLPLMRYAREGTLTLLTASRRIEASHLPVLREQLLAALAKEDRLDSEPSSPPCWAHVDPGTPR
ncbi:MULTISPECIES: DUF488 domain-containing protein [unclassified Halomonas]|uniref:DUF488 domain-containing protein n=1 Tax=unclassified Halomonas TaxID=2609666 RepID=UPI0007F171E3|nr:MULTISPECIES: DUF488 family protein [unclassified Halomonas]SBR51616.1 Uncharacterized conserved protein YeaO, DUF488 family [Halomonas sp. HL-93]SNY97434.1 Uncharacterized conserved protein YeaO, DUF488 family [Halomonas sp. hl-4]